MTERLARAWLFATLVLLFVVSLARFFGRPFYLTDFFFHQDQPVLLALAAVAAALIVFPGLRATAATGLRPLTRIGPPFGSVPLWVWTTILALATAALAVFGVGAVMDGYPLSTDEFMAGFDATIFRHGQTMAPLAPLWRPFASALQPMFMLPTPGNAFFVSGYLPVNAAMRAIAGMAGAASLLNPALAALSIAATFVAARRLWPERPAVALLAAALLATSSQVLLTAMTPYAMTAHLAFNLVWLCLFLRGGVFGHAGALVVGFLACGLHQLLLHPLFAAPFVLQLWLERRWRAALLYTAAYAAMGLFWLSYFPLALHAAGAATTTATGVGASWNFHRASDLVARFNAMDLAVMAANLIRFLTWQSLLTGPLLVASFAAAWRAKGAVRSLALGLPLNIAVMLGILAYQGHGWGYRYLHGLLGSAALLAAWTWDGLVAQIDVRERAVAAGAFAAAAVLSVAVLLPLRAWQAHRFLAPYAAAEQAIRRARTGVVLVADAGVPFAVDLVRNDPYLRNRPLVLSEAALSSDQIKTLCARFTVAVFGPVDAGRYGLPLANADDDEDLAPCGASTAALWAAPRALGR